MALKITELKYLGETMKYYNVGKPDQFARKEADWLRRPVKVVGNGKRFVHYLIDWVLIYIIQMAYVTLSSLIDLSFLGETLAMIVGGYSFLSTYFFISSLYYMTFEYFTGKTPGKYVTGTIVIDEYGERPGGSAMVRRSLSRLVPFEAFSCLGTRGWHDIWSSTFVVEHKEYKRIQELLLSADENGHYTRTAEMDPEKVPMITPLSEEPTAAEEANSVDEQAATDVSSEIDQAIKDLESGLDNKE